jgi:hypothetical protein
VADGLITYPGSGTCTIVASQAGDADWLAAPDVELSFTVAPAPQSIAWTTEPPADAVVGDTYVPAATATSGLAVEITVDPSAAGVCTIADGLVSLVGAGTCVLDADQAGDANHLAAPRVQQGFLVAPPP